MKERAIRLLRWSERYTKTDMVYFAGNGTRVLFGQLTVGLTAFITTVVLAHILNQETFGQYRFITAVIPIIGLLALSSLGGALARTVTRSHAVLWGQLLRVKLLFGLGAAASATLIAGWYWTQGNLLLAQLYGIVAFAIPSYDLFLLYNDYLQGAKQFKYASLYVGITRIVQATLVIGVALITHNILLILIAFFLGLLMPQYIFYRRTRKRHMHSAQHPPEAGLTTYALHLSLLQAVVVLTASIDKIATWHYLGAQQFAIYSVALALPLNILLLFNFIPQIYFPHISTMTLDVPTRKRVLGHITLMLMLLTLVGTLYALVAPILLPLLFRQYVASVPVTLILAALIPLLSTNAVIAKILQTHDMVRHVVLTRILFTLVFVSAFFMLYGSGLGLRASAWGFVLGEGAVLITGMLLLRYARVNN